MDAWELPTGLCIDTVTVSPVGLHVYPLRLKMLYNHYAHAICNPYTCDNELGFPFHLLQGKRKRALIFNQCIFLPSSHL